MIKKDSCQGSRLSPTWPKLGILGGGQLGRMLLEPALRLPIDISILDPDPHAPCSSICANFSCGELLDEATVLRFCTGLDVVTIEIESVNAEALAKVQDSGIKVFPRPETIRVAQDKGLQKKLFDDLEIPTAPYTLISAGQDAVRAPLPHQKIFKLRRGGYDGRGVMAASTLAELPALFQTSPCVLEDKIEIDTELAIMVARSADGTTVLFPPVEMVFDPQAHLVRLLLCPARITAKERAQLEDAARKVATKLDLVGVLALEFFRTKTGEILVNEIAPRPHNSGHHTIEATASSQFDAHLRAILGLPLREPSLTVGAAAMINVLGPEGQTGQPDYPWLAEVLALSGVTPHLYGKRETRPMRKLGHITITGASSELVLERVEQVERCMQRVRTR